MRNTICLVAFLFSSACSQQPSTAGELEALIDKAVDICGFDALTLGATSPNHIIINDQSHFKGLTQEEGRQLQCVFTQLEDADLAEIEFRREVVDFDSFRSQLPEIEQ